jgi:serine/threonine protein kinase
MELVRGVPITGYCDQNKLPVHERLELFVQVCRAVEHAHQKGIIHRDIKPSNVLVTLNDGRPVPKVIDFGVAKATNQQLTEKTLFTAFAQVIGTPLYMSPEQAQMSSLDIDTRSDIYSLGVLLYELLTGTTPFDQERLRTAAYDEMRRIIREEEPPKPSTRISTTGEARNAIAAHRQVDARRLGQLIKGDLDWIVMKCLEKDRSRRFGTAAGVAEDIGRYLSDQPVEARRPTRSYRLRKFIRRNKFGVLAGSAVALALALGLILALIGFLQARRQSEIARQQAARSEQVSQFLKDMLAGVGPSVARGNDTKMLRSILDKTAARVQRGFADDPGVEAELCYTLGITYVDLADYEHAEPMFQNAVDEYREAFGNVNTNVALALARLGATQTWLNKASVGKGTAAEAVGIARKCGNKGILARCLYYQSRSLAAYVDTAEGAPLLREAIALEKEVGDDPPLLGVCMIHLASSLDDEPGYRAEAESLMREALALHRKHLDANDGQISNDLFLLTQCLMKQGKLEEAESAAREVFDFDRRVFDKDHLQRAYSASLLGHVLIVQSKWDQAETLFKEAIDASPSNGRYWGLLGDLNARRGDWQAAVDKYSRVVELDPVEDRAPLFFAVALMKTGKYDIYRQHCHRYLERYHDTHEFGEADKAAKVALLLPVDGADLDRACELADFAATATEPKSLLPWVRFCKSLAEYRRGHFDSTIDWADRALSSNGENYTPSQAGDYFLKACAYGQLQQMDSARAALAKGNQSVQQARTQVSSDFGGFWADWAIADLLREEAEKILADKPGSDAKSEKHD